VKVESLEKVHAVCHPYPSWTKQPFHQVVDIELAKLETVHPFLSWNGVSWS